MTLAFTLGLRNLAVLIVACIYGGCIPRKTTPESIPNYPGIAVGDILWPNWRGCGAQGKLVSRGVAVIHLDDRLAEARIAAMTGDPRQVGPSDTTRIRVASVGEVVIAVSSKY